jgi:hypothetical protein
MSDAGASDAGPSDAGPSDAGTSDAGASDPGASDAGNPIFDAGDAETCANGIIDPGEACDGTNLNGHSCTEFGYLGGTLACRPDCASFDFTECSPQKVEISDDVCDDDCWGYVNGQQEFAVLLGTSSGWVDVSGVLNHAMGATNQVEFKVENDMQGWAYKFQIREDGVVAWHDQCGQIFVYGCENDSYTSGIVYDQVQPL